MTTLEMAGYIAAALIGLSLGLIGSGGSILTVPVLVYMLHVEPVLATAYSLFAVGTTSFIGGLNFSRKKLVDYKTGFVFAVPSLIAVYLTRLLLIPMLPEILFSIGSFSLTTDMGIMLLFAIMMFLAAISMIRDSRKEASTKEQEVRFNVPLILLEGAVVGVLTGLVGAGGGFLIIPALVLFARIPMKMAIGTSLFIIAIKSLIGFVGDVQAGQPIEWQLLITFTGIAVFGILVGGFLTKYIKGSNLQKSFGYFVLIMALVVIIKELFFQ